MRRLGLMLASVVTPLLLLWASPVASVAKPDPSRLPEVQRKLKTAQQGLARRRSREQVLTTDIARYAGGIRVAQARVNTLARRQAVVQRELDRRQAALARTQTSLRAQRARLVRLRGRLQVARRALARRMVELYEADRPDLVTVVLNADGFANLLERMDFLGRIADADRGIVGTVRVARVQSGRTTRRLTALEQTRRGLADAVTARRDTIARVRRGRETARDALTAARQTRRDALASVRTSRRDLQREVSGLRAQQASITRTLRAAQATNAAVPPQRGVAPGPIRGAGGGPMIWPVNGPITSPYCERRSYEACHPGIDISAPEGTPIRAAAAGRVALLQSPGASGGYGNYTCVQHAGNLSSCYAHQSRFGTTLGASVRQGQVIGYVGNTGRSFGAHLHWEVRVNGTITNPLGYL